MIFKGNGDLPIWVWTWKCWVNLPNEIAIFHRDNDQQNHWVQWGTRHFQTHPYRGKSWPWNFPYANHGAGIFTYKTGWCLGQMLGQMLVNIPYMEHMGLGVYRYTYLYRKPHWTQVVTECAERMMLDEFWMNLNWTDQIQWAYWAAILVPKISY